MTDPPRLTTGQPSTIGVWRDLAADMWGEHSAAVTFLDRVCDMGSTRDDPVSIPEHRMFQLLTALNREGEQGE